MSYDSERENTAQTRGIIDPIWKSFWLAFQSSTEQAGSKAELFHTFALQDRIPSCIPIFSRHWSEISAFIYL